MFAGAATGTTRLREGWRRAGQHRCRHGAQNRSGDHSLHLSAYLKPIASDAKMTLSDIAGNALPVEPANHADHDAIADVDQQRIRANSNPACPAIGRRQTIIAGVIDPVTAAEIGLGQSDADAIRLISVSARKIIGALAVALSRPAPFILARLAEVALVEAKIAAVTPNVAPIMPKILAVLTMIPPFMAIIPFIGEHGARQHHAGKTGQQKPAHNILPIHAHQRALLQDCNLRLNRL
jgi:hypothetical protein